MLIQTVSRRIVGYPITLLEVHTLVHVACAIGMYGLWFQKPLDIRDPAWLDFSDFEDLVALMLVRNYGFGARVEVDDQEEPVPIKSSEHRFANGSESAYLHLYSLPENGEKESMRTDIVAREMQSSTSDRITKAPTPHWSLAGIPNLILHDKVGGFDYAIKPHNYGPAICAVTSGQSLECGIGPAMNVQQLWGTRSRNQHDGHLQISLTSRDVRRWTLAASAAKRIGEDLYRDSPKDSVNYFTFYAHSIFLDRKGLQAGFYAYFAAWASGGLVAALTICMFYGAAHATAWNFLFPTKTERLLWRIACVDTVAGVISLLAVFSVVVFYHEHGANLLKKSFLSREPGVLPMLYRVIILLGLLNFPFFLASRLYIIIETFISLRHVQLGVYQTVDWTDYIPHL